MSKCKGCGITLQFAYPSEVGYSPKVGSKLCQRCFKIANYNSKEISGQKISDKELIKKINAQNVFTFFLVDLLSLNKKVMELYEQITNAKCLLITKVDIIPKNFDRVSLEKRIRKIYGVKDILFSSSINGYGKNELINICEEKSKVLFIGPSSSGKSSLINYLFAQDLTVSNYQNTTQDFLTIKCGGFSVIDAPGFNSDLNINEEKVKGNIKPRTMRMKKEYCLEIGNSLISFTEDTNITLFFPESILLKTKKMIGEGESLDIAAKSDLVLGMQSFIYFKNKARIKVWSSEDLEIRESVVGFYE